MAAKKQPEEIRPSLQIEMVDGQARTVMPVYHYRFLFANGDVLDIDAVVDDNKLRLAVLEHRDIDNDRIEGVAEIEQVGCPPPGAML